MSIGQQTAPAGPASVATALALPHESLTVPMDHPSPHDTMPLLQNFAPPPLGCVTWQLLGHELTELQRHPPLQFPFVEHPRNARERRMGIRTSVILRRVATSILEVEYLAAMILSRLVLVAFAVGSIQCGGKEPAPVTPPTTSTPAPSDAAADVTPVQDAGASTAAATPDAAPAEPTPTAQDVCLDNGQRVHFTVSIQGCGLKLGKSSTDEGGPGVVRVVFSAKSTCKKMDAVKVELMTMPLQQHRFQLMVEDDAGKAYADQMVSTGSLPPCGAKK
jgi:hypothetical protein